MSEAELLYGEMRSRPLPRLGKTLPNFLAYDSALAGALQSASHDLSPTPLVERDAEADALATELRQKQLRTRDESEFLEYFDFLDRVLTALAQRHRA